MQYCYKKNVEVLQNVRSETKLYIREKEFSPMYFTSVAGKATTKKNA